MKKVMKHLGEQQQGFAVSPFVTFMLDPSFAPQDRLRFLPCLAPLVMGSSELASSLAGVIYQQLIPAIGGGRVAAFEVLIANTAVRAMIKEGRTDQIRSVLQTSLREGSQTLERSLNQLLRAGLITERDARGRSGHATEIRV